MALPKRLFEVFTKIENCKLVANQDDSTEAINEFAALLNESSPINEEETFRKKMVIDMYNSNPESFTRYVTNSKNRVSALILYLGCRAIVYYFRINKLAHVLWNTETTSYDVAKFVPREREKVRVVHNTGDAAQHTNEDHSNTVLDTTHDTAHITLSYKFTDEPLASHNYTTPQDVRYVAQHDTTAPAQATEELLRAEGYTTVRRRYRGNSRPQRQRNPSLNKGNAAYVPANRRHKN